jgi:hypothetical protein
MFQKVSAAIVARIFSTATSINPHTNRSNLRRGVGFRCDRHAISEHGSLRAWIIDECFAVRCERGSRQVLVGSAHQIIGTETDGKPRINFCLSILLLKKDFHAMTVIYPNEWTPSTKFIVRQARHYLSV